MYTNPYQIFGIDDNINPLELRQILRDYQIRAVAFNKLYDSYIIKFNGVTAHATKQSQLVEQLLSRRYEFGLDFEQIPLGTEEIRDFLNRALIAQKKYTGESEVSTITMEEARKRVDTLGLSLLYVRDIDKLASEAINAFDDNQENTSQMMDAVLKIRYGELKIDIAKELAKRASSEGVVLDENSFWDLMVTSSPYKQLKSIYEQVATKDKRDELIPEIYVKKNMSDMSEVTVIGTDTIRHLLEKEHKYANEYFYDIVERFEGIKDRSEPALRNQNHDYAWGMVLDTPKVIIDNEPVNTPIFQGRIRVERLGSFTEKSLFARNKYAREVAIRMRRRAKAPKQRGFLSRLTMKHGDEKDSDVPQTMREHFYLHEARKTMVDNIWKVTKTDKNGIASTYIIFTPLEYLGIRGSELLEFVKNIYLSDYMLDIAMRNGGYAGRVQAEDDGFSISTKFCHEEIASAVLFRNGQKGDIYDCRELRK